MLVRRWLSPSFPGFQRFFFGGAIILVLSGEWMGMGVAGMIITMIMDISRKFPA